MPVVEAARGQRGDAVATDVLDRIPPATLRDTSRARLRDLDHDLFATPDPGLASRELRDHIRELPALVPVGRISDEPNGL